MPNWVNFFLSHKAVASKDGKLEDTRSCDWYFVIFRLSSSTVPTLGGPVFDSRFGRVCNLRYCRSFHNQILTREKTY